MAKRNLFDEYECTVIHRSFSQVFTLLTFENFVSITHDMSEPTPTLSLHIDCIAGAGTSSVPVMLESSSDEEDSESDCLSDDMQDDPDWHTVTLHQEGKYRVDGHKNLKKR